MTGSQADVRVVQGCLNDLVDAGLVREPQRRFYRRIEVEEKPKPKELKMPAAQSKTEPQTVSAPSKPVGSMDVLGELAAEIVGMAEHLKRLAARVEDAALLVEQEREATAKSMDGYRQLKALLKSLQGEGE